jgi:RHS repeat-associated protein
MGQSRVTAGEVETIVHSSGLSAFGPHTPAGAYTFDARGRLVNPNGQTTTYTEFDLPRQIGETQFRYDAEGTRVSKTGPTGTHLTLGGLYERRVDAQGTTDVYLVPGPEGVVAQISLNPSEPSGGHVTYLHGSRKGSVQVASTAAGVVERRLYYDPFGARTNLYGAPLTTTPGDVQIGFNGLDHDDELGLINQRGRVYNPSLRRFLTPDPIISNPLNGQTFNPYSYVRNDPVNRTDPSGYCDSSPCGEGGYVGSDGGWRSPAELAAESDQYYSSAGEEEVAATFTTATTTRQAAPAPPVSIGINDQTATPVRSAAAAGTGAGPLQPMFAGTYIEPEGTDWFIVHGDRVAGLTAAVGLVPLAVVTVSGVVSGTAAVGFGGSAMGWLSGLTMSWVGGREVVFGAAEGDEGRMVEGAVIGLSGWGMVGEGLGSGPRAQPPAAGKGGANPATRAAASRGSTLHADKSGHLPDQLRARYPDTQFEFTKPGIAGQDVRVVSGTHPSEYPGSTWPAGVNHADFKPGTPTGVRTFARDQATKWSETTQMLTYDPSTGLLQ